MRNTTQLKAILQLFHVEFSMDDSITIQMTLVDKETNDFESFENESYSSLIRQAYNRGYKKKKRSSSLTLE